MATIIKTSDRIAKQDWDQYYKSYIEFSSANHNETESDRKKRITKLESDFEQWKIYYFEKYVVSIMYTV